VLTASWRYKWQTNEGHVNHRFDLLEINYINMPWISDRFKEQYLDSLGKQNAILRYNYENLLITKLGYTYTYNSLGSNAITTYGQNAWVLKANIETSGNVLSVLTKALDTKTNDQGQRTFCGIAFAQYVRGDLDYSKSFRIDNNNSVAIHAAFGIAIPYGNSNLVPFEKRYFAGGANSLRGWSVRSLGPGAYKGADKQINFLNQSGDVKLDMSIEFRSHLFWKINGALFVDGGNIWTIRKYEDQPEGEFKIDKFYKQLAMSYGLGLRVVLDFFTLRFDMGMKGINPAYTGRDHWPLLHPKLKRDFAFHFAVGLPF
jgi:outer membrane protein assembly factor BamA